MGAVIKFLDERRVAMKYRVFIKQCIYKFYSRLLRARSQTTIDTLTVIVAWIPKVNFKLISFMVDSLILYKRK